MKAIKLITIFSFVFFSSLSMSQSIKTYYGTEKYTGEFRSHAEICIKLKNLIYSEENENIEKIYLPGYAFEANRSASIDSYSATPYFSIVSFQVQAGSLIDNYQVEIRFGHKSSRKTMKLTKLPKPSKNTLNPSYKEEVTFGSYNNGKNVSTRVYVSDQDGFMKNAYSMWSAVV
ncbi:MAG: C2 domain-containing protein [Bacteriovoracaceae bacterium]|nr:C2 domain-containing protein [Bacteriovoracaceae bacterium]